MPYRDDSLTKARITLFYDKDAKKLLPYLKVEPFDSVAGHDTNDEYYVPFVLPAGVTDRFTSPYQVIIEQKSDGAFPSGTNRGQAVGPLEIHRFGDV